MTAEYYCKYDKDTNPSTCTGCEKRCLRKRPAAYINREFEEAVKEMQHGQRTM